ncbi:MAG: hypothetical protein EON93_01395 [Burkholderiales bacterium]|nr:MAG: hypothetical protein EON93_01395 [Burkholderiales bacterium]
MKRYVLAGIGFVAVLFATELFRFGFERQMAPWLGNSIGEVLWRGDPGRGVSGYVVVSATAYAIAFCFGGAAFGAWLRSTQTAVMASALLSAIYLLVHFFFGGLMPIGGGFSDGPRWMVAIDWANWWLPPLASVGGALLAVKMIGNAESSAH